MRVLFVSTPGIGHVFPMVPLAWALRLAGHEVLVATSGAALAAERAGLHTVDVAPGTTMEQLFALVAEEDPDMVQRMRTARITDVREAIIVFARISAYLTDGVVAAAEAWRPDIVVHSQIQASGLVAAAKLGVPAVEHAFGFARTAEVNHLFPQHMTDTLDRHGVTELPEHAGAVEIAPPSMLDGEPNGWLMRATPYNGGGIMPPWLLEQSERPRIAVTLGTVAPHMNGLGPVERIISVAGQVDAEFVLALGDADTSALGELPENVRAVGWVPLGGLLATCSAAIHHGGAGTTLTVLDAGVPQLVLPSGADRYINAEAVHQRGAGLSAEEDQVDAALIRELLSNEKLRETAREVRAEMAAMPAAHEVVSRLTELVAG